MLYAENILKCYWKSSQVQLRFCFYLGPKQLLMLLLLTDRQTPIGQIIDQYLKGETDLEDHAIHLLFSANRWEMV